MTADYFSLGATLYTPCTHPNLERIFQRGLGARSMVYCTEDSVNPQELGIALENLANALYLFKPNKEFLRFIRPRNSVVLEKILLMPGIEKVNGFVLPKCDLHSLPNYLSVLHKAKKRFSLMPTLETEQILDPLVLPKIRDILNQIKSRIICLRIGGNDLLNLMGLKRLPGISAYDTPLRSIIDQLLLTFRPVGYEISAPVFDFIDDRATLADEVARDISYGMFAKTAIHPCQLQVIEELYTQYAKIHMEQARAISANDASAVFLMNGQMMERTCHRTWARRTLALVSHV
ncbi:HpcH/HpaI aldolase/citrate lyase family protein [Microbulbifer guangxiensis]|uniref:HpcH/HpaI aldolase/citrate lyase family protein n=1 Tax=Microbulbifer guangxiensis TaxID=2904249 RepID=UPI001F324B7D|nr:HpcH/HpaI aldolase/citrate lyase family protein [Microbulbifer guangxiensis]